MHGETFPLVELLDLAGGGQSLQARNEVAEENTALAPTLRGELEMSWEYLALLFADQLVQARGTGRRVVNQQAEVEAEEWYHERLAVADRTPRVSQAATSHVRLEDADHVLHPALRNAVK